MATTTSKPDFTISEPITSETRAFENSSISIQGDIKEGGLTFRNCTLKTGDVMICNCTFEGCAIEGYARKYFLNCTFIDCLLNHWSEGVLAGCTVIGCALSLDGGYFINCSFINPKQISPTHCKIHACQFSDILTDDDGYEDAATILMEDVCMDNCIFSNVRLTGDAYLINGTDDCFIANCQFTNCCTERDDLQIILTMQTGGKVHRWLNNPRISIYRCTGVDKEGYLSADGDT